MGWRAWFRGDVELVDAPLSIAPPVRPELRRIAAEAVIWQDEAERVLSRIRRREAFDEIAREAGPLVRRFFALRDELPHRCEDPDDERVRSLLDVVLNYDAMVLATAQELLAQEWRSERISQQVDTFGSLGPPARRLEQAYAELAAAG